MYVLVYLSEWLQMCVCECACVCGWESSHLLFVDDNAWIDIFNCISEFFLYISFFLFLFGFAFFGKYSTQNLSSRNFKFTPGELHINPMHSTHIFGSFDQKMRPQKKKNVRFLYFIRCGHWKIFNH